MKLLSLNRLKHNVPVCLIFIYEQETSDTQSNTIYAIHTNKVVVEDKI